MKLDIRWSPPYKITEGAMIKWRREWCIPSNLLDGFFSFWKRARFQMLSDGFSVIKSDATNEWFLLETKDSESSFKSFGNTPKNESYIEPHPGFVLPEYKIKNESGLRPWQIGAANRLVAAINVWGAAIDGSDMGSGKTFTACAVARELNTNILVICPKAVIKSWTTVICDHFNMKEKLVGVINYEKIRTGSSNSSIASFVRSRHTKRSKFTWKIPKKTLIIYDESQKLKNWQTKNAKICLTVIKEGFPILFCSATNATNPLEMRVVGQALKIYKGGNSYWDWAKKHGVYKGGWGMEFDNDPLALKRLNHTVFDQHGIRLRRDDIPGFPECEIIADAYNIEEKDAKLINKIYAEMEAELEIANSREKSDKDKADKEKKRQSELIIQLRARQKIELIKIPLLVEMVEDAIEQGFSVAVFVNFTDTIKALQERLHTNCIFDGKTSDLDRDTNVESFQNDSARIILVNTASGGAGLSLHDLNGKYPRMSLISPSYSPVLMRQALGRVWRDAAKTKAIQKIVCVANTIEEAVCKNVQQKLNNLDLLNDGDLKYSTIIDSKKKK